ncbi:glutaredoxin family protein [Bacillus pseudomycoides]|uniref:glutaredoxin family protein n=1 Tax=Bacillus pseudomycoides TaxID=64104 RepID=UPI0023DAEF15|nr:glutaredoxin family protein [Bacillus pseudomycoides]MDF2083919.1 glutaredoxin family protein [Bacillus pseudomycoides]
MKKTVTVYGSDNCHFCIMLKNWLEKKHIKYTMKDVNQNDVKTEFQTYNAQGIPLIIIKDFETKTEQKIVGFNEEKLEKTFIK